MDSDGGATELCPFDAVRQTSMEPLSRGETLGLPRRQIGALIGLANAAADLGRWREVIDWAERLCVLAQAAGALRDLAAAQLFLDMAMATLDEHGTVKHGYEQALDISRAIGARRNEAALPQRLGGLHREQAHAALPLRAQAQAVYQSFGDPSGDCRAVASAAPCEAWLGRSELALAAVNGLLRRLDGDFAEHPAHETIELRWTCHRVLAPAGDARATAMLERLLAGVQARTAE